MCLQIWKLHDVVTNIDRHVSSIIKNANIVLIKYGKLLSTLEIL